MHRWRLEHTHHSAQGRVRWGCWGDRDRPPVVLVHGTPFSSGVWRHIARALAQHHRVYAWDMPGYGQSEQSEDQDLSLAALGEVFAALLDHWEVADPAVVAHDSGAAVALGARLLHGARYRRLALVDAVAVAPWGSPFFRAAARDPAPFTRLPNELHRSLLRAYIATASGPGLHPAALEALLEPWTGAAGQAAFYRQLAQRGGDPDYTDRLRDAYATLDMPVLVCWGGRDTWIPVARAHDLADRIPGARVRIIPGAGHLIQEDAPAELTAALLGFLHDLS